MKTIFFLSLGILFISGGLICLFFWFRNRKKISDEFFRQVASQIISVILASIISFSYVYSLWTMQEEQKVEDIRLDSFIGIANEVSGNRLMMELDNTFVPSLLETNAWEIGKYKTPIETPFLLDGLKILYIEIDKYNWEMQFIRHKVKVDKLTKEKLPEEAKKAWERRKTYLLDKLREFEKLTARESVILKQTKKEDYIERFGEWKDEVEIPFFKKPKNKQNP